MILVDTSVWIGHFRSGDAKLARLLDDSRVLCHPFVIGELACGNLKRRDDILALLAVLPRAATVEHDELLAFLTRHRLHGRGLGLVDLHLLASAVLANVPLWTLDRKLAAAARDLGAGFTR